MRNKLASLQNLPRSPLGSHVTKAYHHLADFGGGPVLQWLRSYWKNRIGRKHPFQTWKTVSGVFTMPDVTKISIAGDWGSGTQEAAWVAQQIKNANPNYTIHLGDVYYVGDQAETESNFLGMNSAPGYVPCIWPDGSARDFALQGNHEMYARGYAYFDSVLPVFNQEASFFCLENDYWRVVGLDTGYNSVSIPLIEEIIPPSCLLNKQQLDWLRNVVFRKKDNKGIIFLTHHQYFSAFEKQYPKLGEQLAEFSDVPVLWIWGHEHRFAIYGRHRLGNGIEAYGRCIGHGGMPVELCAIKNHSAPLLFTDTRSRSTEGITVGYNGHANLTFACDSLHINYVDLMGLSVICEKFTATTNGVAFKGFVPC